MTRCLALLFAAAGLVACQHEPPHTADDSSWLRVDTAKSRPVEPAEKAKELKQALSEQPNPWAPPKTSDAVVPTSMNKPPPATEIPGVASGGPDVPHAMPQPDPL